MRLYNDIHAAEAEATFGLRPLPCPFCNSGNVGLHGGSHPHATCFTCRADGPVEGDPRVAITKWNAAARPSSHTQTQPVFIPPR